MPILNRLTGDPDNNSPDSPNGHRDEPQPKGISPIVPGRPGRPSFSLEALCERVELQFYDETANRADILLTLSNEAERRAFLAEIVDYVLAIEAIGLTASDRADLIERTFRRLFTLGPLEASLDDETVTGITISGPFDIHVERNLRASSRLDTAFADAYQLEDYVKRLVASAGIIVPEGDPFIEAGTTLKGRRVRLNIIAPPISPFYTVDMRVHPRQPLRLDDLQTRLGVLSAEAAILLRRILSHRHGLLIVGDTGLGKTTLAAALAADLIAAATGAAVEHAAEMHLPDSIHRYAPHPGGPEDTPRDFASAVAAALATTPDWLVLDEIRSDDSAAIWSALDQTDAPRYLWVMRADPRPERLRTALTMFIRKAQPGLDQTVIEQRLAAQLPFVAALKRHENAPRLDYIAEWMPDDTGTPGWQPLIQFENGSWQARYLSQRLPPP